MAIQADFSLPKWCDGNLTITIAPPAPIGGWSLELQVTKRLGSSSGLITKSMSSGYYNVSGMNITNSGGGIFQAKFFKQDTSGLDFGNYAYTVQRTDSGLGSQVAFGSFIILPNNLP